MNLEDLVIPEGRSPLEQRAAERAHPDAAAVYDLMESSAHHLALTLIAIHKHEDDAPYRHDFRSALVRATFAHRRITPGDTTADRLISEADQELIHRRANAIVQATIQEHHP